MMLPLAFFYQNSAHILKDQLTQKHLWVLAFLETATKKEIDIVRASYAYPPRDYIGKTLNPLDISSTCMFLRGLK